MIRKTTFRFVIYLFAAMAAALGGCVVPQGRGRGTRFFLREPASGRAYFVYLPVGYTPSMSWPLVLSLHGMKPFDHAESQELEWEMLADKHRMVVVAPDIHNSDLFMEYPLRRISRGVAEDERVVMKIVKYVTKGCNIDPRKIYATSWSSGGYLLHYIVANNPDIFAAVCARGSCFSIDTVNSIPKRKVARLAERKIPVMIYYGSNDFGGVRQESKQAIKWYKKLDIPVASEIITGRGHSRVPDLAADFFSQHGGPARPVQPVHISASYERGVAPFWVNFTARLPGVQPHEYHKHKFAWFVNGKLQGTESTWLGTLYKTGGNVVKLQVTTPDKSKYEAEKTVWVVPRQVHKQ